MAFDLETYNWPAFQGRKPFLHQKHTVKFVLENRNCFILNEMGTGKTLSVLWALDILFTAKRIRKVVVICPLSTMKIVWMNEIFLNMPHRRAGIAHGNKQYRLSVLHDPSCEIVITNHDAVKVIGDEILRERPDLIIIDEVTAFKSNSDRTKLLKALVKIGREQSWLKGVWSLTGDLTPESPVDAFYPCQITVPKNQYLPQYYGQFRDACLYQVSEYRWIAKQEAPQIVAMCTQPAIRFTRDQCLDLPETMYQLMDVPLTKEQLQYYELMRKEAYIESESGEIKAVNAAVKLNKLLQISAGAVKNTDGQVIELDCKDRLDALYEVYEQTPQHKLVVFATYRATIQQLLAFFTKKGVRVAAIHGDVHQNLRAQYIESFQSGDLQVLILQPQSSAHGITLTAANTIVWYSLIASNELYQQGNARIVRPGQIRKTLIIVFASTKAERHIASILERKGNVSAEILKLFVDKSL
jgi:SNF2 family DNA or RNA helicase